ncbi:ArsR/SmtB family transcription factor [Puerhibacterium sp. TATVAM-FAB25]|uniref:ArsR/SmtB family transcription factor n=1 Tax=Puerhibacterium sp. TATVAM-FAB25 TaxID=3093699 RepID=UPI00397B3BA6
MSDVPERPYTHVELTAESVRVLAHPLRSRLLSALRKGGPASATRLAAELQTNTGATSYHLRRLESVGLVADTGEGRGKERIWRATTASHGWRGSAFADDEDARTALGWLVRGYHQQFDEEYARWLDAADAWPAPWQDVSGMSDAWVEVTPEQARAMQDELAAVVDRYLSAGAGDPAARRLHVYRVAFPLDPSDVPGEGDDGGAPASDGGDGAGDGAPSDDGGAA